MVKFNQCSDDATREKLAQCCLSAKFRCRNGQCLMRSYKILIDAAFLIINERITTCMHLLHMKRESFSLKEIYYPIALNCWRLDFWQRLLQSHFLRFSILTIKIDFEENVFPHRAALLKLWLLSRFLVCVDVALVSVIIIIVINKNI